METPDAGWQVSENTAEELIPVLYGPCARVEEVSTGSPPEINPGRMDGLVNLDVKDFARNPLHNHRETKPPSASVPATCQPLHVKEEVSLWA